MPLESHVRCSRNDMARPASITLQRVSDSAVLWQTGAYAYDGAGNIKTLGSDWFTYDGVNRLTVGTASAGALRQCTSYNAFGALTGLGTGTTRCTPSAIGVDAATNRMASPVTYDAAGNMTAWGGKTYSWTRDNQMLTTTGTGINRSYVYTSDGERVLDRNNLDSTRTVWIRDLSGKVLREYARTGAGVWSWSKDYVLRDGQQAATVTAAATRHLHLDHLGTVRRMTDTQATPQLVAAASRDYYPFGLETARTSDPERMRFTGHQRDTQGTTTQADDVDYMHARYYNPTVGEVPQSGPGLEHEANDEETPGLEPLRVRGREPVEVGRSERGDLQACRLRRQQRGPVRCVEGSPETVARRGIQVCECRQGRHRKPRRHLHQWVRQPRDLPEGPWSTHGQQQHVHLAHRR